MLSRSRVLARGAAVLAALAALSSCVSDDHDHQIVVSVPEQRMAVLRRGHLVAAYPVSTSRFCLGDRPGSNGTPLGRLQIAEKIGTGQPVGAVFKSRRPTGEVVAVNAPGRDPIVTRILWLRGQEVGNNHAYGRCIYIHGTPEERNIGRPASFGCVRMRSRDVIALYDEVGKGAEVDIANAPLLSAARGKLLPDDRAGLLALAPPGPAPTTAGAVRPTAATVAVVSAHGAPAASLAPPAAVTGPQN